MNRTSPLMKHDPADGGETPYPSEASQWRAYHGRIAWLFNPWTGDRRDARDVGSDPFGHLIRAPNETLRPAQVEEIKELAIGANDALVVTLKGATSQETYACVKQYFEGLFPKRTIIVHDESSNIEVLRGQPRHWVFDAAEAHRKFIPAAKAEHGIVGTRGWDEAVGVKHLEWMLDEITKREMSPTKACRWLGWVQACLCAYGTATLDELKEINLHASINAG